MLCFFSIYLNGLYVPRTIVILPSGWFHDSPCCYRTLAVICTHVLLGNGLRAVFSRWLLHLQRSLLCRFWTDDDSAWQTLTAAVSSHSVPWYWFRRKYSRFANIISDRNGFRTVSLHLFLIRFYLKQLCWKLGFGD